MDTGNFTRPHIDELSLTSENEPSSGKTFYNLIPSNEPKQMYIQKTKQNKKNQVHDECLCMCVCTHMYIYRIPMYVSV